MRSAGFSTSDPSLLDIVMAAAVRVLGVPSIRPDTPLVSMGLDSVARLCIVDLVEDATREGGLRLVVDDRAVARAETCDSIAAALATAP